MQSDWAEHISRMAFELDDKYLTELGRIAARFATLKFLAGRMILALITTDINAGDLIASTRRQEKRGP
jgi:hypothetical protein